MRDIISHTDDVQAPDDDGFDVHAAPHGTEMVPGHRAPWLWRAANKLGLINPAAAPGADPYIHIVGWGQSLLERLRLTVPRARCGALQVIDGAEPRPGPDAPLCPDCVARSR